MKHTVILAILAACFGAPCGFRTANASEPPVAPPVDPEIKRQIDEQAEQIAQQSEEIEQLKQKLASATSPAPEPVSSNLALLCKGAGVDLSDVRWRVAAGLDEKQAVDAAVAQKESDARAKQAAKKGGK